MSPFYLDFCSVDGDFRRGLCAQSEPGREPRSSGCFIPGLSALFMSLDAFFVGIIQVLVYAGAVMVLFHFHHVLHIRTEELRRINWLAAAGGVGVAVILLVRSTL